MLRWFRKAVPPKKAPDPDKKLVAGLGATPGETFVSRREDPDGAHVLDKTRSKKPVYASGAESDKYTPEDHGDAAAIHLRAHDHHEARAKEHRGKVDGKDWKLDEAHEVDAERHESLADHHHEVARNHLVAAGRGSTVGLFHAGGRLQLGVAKQHGKEEREEAKKFFHGRTHHDHPGGVTERDKAAYRGENDMVKARLDGHEARITRDAFLYLDPKPPREEFAQCGTCMMFTGRRCTIHGPAVKIEAGMSCGLYVHGKPALDKAGSEKALVTPKESGLVERQVRCDNCRSFDEEKSSCRLYEKLNKALPEIFNLETKVDEDGCCNGQMPVAADRGDDE